MPESSSVRRVLTPEEEVTPLPLLLLEDSKLDARIITAALGSASCRFEVTRVDSRESFLSELEARRFSLILSDYNVPGFAGEDALQLAMELCPAAPFIFVSGALGEHTAIELLKRGATDYVLKDRLERLVPSVERALAETQEKLERRRAEERLTERERTLSNLIGNLPGVAFRRGPERPWRLSFVSGGCTELTGYPPDRFCEGELNWESLLEPEDVERFADEAAEAFGAGRQLTVSYRIRTASGELRWIWERSVAQCREDGSIEYIEGFASDITQQKAAESELRRRVEFEQQLIGIVSHDLRNPLNAISLGASLLLKREEMGEASTRSVRRILSSAERAGRMIRDLLDFTQVRLGAGLPLTRREADLQALARGVVDEFEFSQPHRRVVLTPCAAYLARGNWDPDRVTQALTNLVGNALSYSPPDSTVTVRCFADEQTCGVEVHNLGEPISPERLPQLFKPLSRGVKEVNVHMRSIGLGLFIVHSIAAAHGGSISVRSTHEEGTTFILTLPRHAGTATS